MHALSTKAQLLSNMCRPSPHHRYLSTASALTDKYQLWDNTRLTGAAYGSVGSNSGVLLPCCTSTNLHGLRCNSARPCHLPLTDKYQLWDNIRLNTRLTGAAYDEDRAVWRLTTAGGEEEEVQVLVLAQGTLALFFEVQTSHRNYASLIGS